MSWNAAPSHRAPPTFRLLRLRLHSAQQSRGAKDRGEYRMTGFALETASELILFGLVPLFLTLATIWILWHSLEKITPDDYVRHNGIRNRCLVGLVSNHRGGGCDRSESKGQKEPTYSADLGFALRVARLVQV